MAKILVIAWKDAILRFSGWAEWLFFVILPILFTLVIAGGSGPAADARIRLVVVDQAGSPLAGELIGALESSAAVRPEVMSLARAEDQFAKRQASAILVIPPELDATRLRSGQVALELRQQPNSVNALVSARAVTAAITRLGSAVGIAADTVAEAERIRPYASQADLQRAFDAALAAAQEAIGQAPARLAVTQAATPDQIEYDPRANSSAGQLITWVFIPLIGISAMFAFERQKGTLKRLLVSPTSRGVYLLGTIAGQVAAALVQMLILVGFGIAVMGLNWGRAPAALAVMLISSVLAAASLGATLGAFVRTEGQAAGLSIMLGMVMALLGGCWYPAELFPQAVRSAVQVLPTTWAMQGLLDIVLRGQGLRDVLPEAGVLLGFAAVFFGVGVWRFRRE
jgi:ABC-2 type transport system permease protein